MNKSRNDNDFHSIPLAILPTDETPLVNYLPEYRRLTISGRLLPEDPTTVFNTLFEWLKNYHDSTNNVLHLWIQLEYFNTASARLLFEFLKVVIERPENTIIWNYAVDDDDMLEAGQEMAEILGVSFGFHSY